MHCGRWWGSRLGRISRLDSLNRGLRRLCGLGKGGGPPMGLKGRAVPPSGFGHGSEACEEGLLRERMRRRIECMCKEKGGVYLWN